MTGTPETETLDTLKQLLDIVQRHSLSTGGEPLNARLSAHLGADAAAVPVVADRIPAHRYVDADIALEMLADRDPDAVLIGVTGDMRHHAEFADMLQRHAFAHTSVGPVDYASLPTGPDTERTCLGFGVRLFRYDGQPVAVLLRQPNPRYGREQAGLEVLCSDRAVAQRLLAELRALSIEHSVLRGQVITLDATGYEATANGVTFVQRPELPAEDVILPVGVLDRIREQVIGFAAHTDALRAQGQHLKRGLLLYGPPGSGKTHTVRHLLSGTPEHTVVLLSGETLRAIGLAAGLARKLEPAIVVLEDCDLIASDRDMMGGLKPLLFEVLDAMDGLDPDADVTFLLTTNRVDDMERALTQRPGRIDLAMEIPLPDDEGRRRLLRLYSPAPDTFSDAGVAEAATATEGTTASFARELVRRAVLLATIAGEPPGDVHLAAATSEMLASASTLARLMSPGAHDHTV